MESTVVGMTTIPEVVASSHDEDDLVLRLVGAAYLGRYTRASRVHTDSDLGLLFAWYAEQNLAPLTRRSGTDRAVCAVDVRSPPIQALAGVAADDCGNPASIAPIERRGPGALARRVCPPTDVPAESSTRLYDLHVQLAQSGETVRESRVVESVVSGII